MTNPFGYYRASTTIDVQLHSAVVSITVIVANITSNAIIGMDFLSKSGCVIDLKNQTLKFDQDRGH
jgi:hypothetical protein